MRFESVKEKLQPNLKEVYGSEFLLYSSKLKTAGATDGIVKWNDNYAILDLKTTKEYKSEKYIENYFVQAATYGIMLNELNIAPFTINKLVIIFSTGDFNSYYFEKNISQYDSLVNKIFKENR